MSHRIVIGECWHNPECDCDWMIRKLSAHFRGGEGPVSDWMKIGVRIAVLFGIYNGEPRDIAVSGDDLSGCMAALYAKSWGLSLGTIVICCRENDAVWDLLHKGELRTGSIPDAGLERLLHACGGMDEVERYYAACEDSGLYFAGDRCRGVMRRHLHASVVGQKRIRSAIPNVLRTSGYLLGPDTALCYSGLQDYRAVAGESRGALVLSDRSPQRDCAYTAEALGITEDELLKHINKG